VRLAVSGSAFDSLAALSVILDLANGLAEDKSLLTATLAFELAGDAGCTEPDQVAAAMAALLRHLGCTAAASLEADVAIDDIALRAKLHRSDSRRLFDVWRAVGKARGGDLQLGLAAVALVTHASALKRSVTTEACGAARALSEQLKLGPSVSRALDEVFEFVDGRGAPRGLRGDEVSLVGRIATVAHVATVFALEGGAALAREVLSKRSGSALDEGLASRARRLVGAMDPSCADYLVARTQTLSRAVERQAFPMTVLDLAQTFGDFADLQAPELRGHARRVAGLVDRSSVMLGFSPDEAALALHAAHLHDLGQAAVPTSIWTMTRVFRPTERERARAHVFLTERILSGAPGLESVAKVAGAHHERLDGSGYHRQAKGSALPRPARLLAAADVLSAIMESRPYRPAKPIALATIDLRRMVRDGQLDEACVEAVLSAAGARSAAPVRGEGLSSREIEVLRLVATGKTNKQIASALGISPRTVQHHTIHIYEKLSVDTRAGAAMVASRRGLLDPA
jgi:HD-GYP domain-containing protein (c-di-GMP phosphodiesterase class II)